MNELMGILIPTYILHDSRDVQLQLESAVWKLPADRSICINLKWAREHLSRKNFALCKIGTENNLADGLTKPTRLIHLIEILTVTADNVRRYEMTTDD
jgi:hypothetical protein